VLRDDGTDLAAALQTIYEIGDGPGLHAAVSDAFPGANLHIELSSAGMEAQLERSEFRRRFSAAELSDGTLKYFCLLAALLTPRPPALLAINEPDANLHPQLLEPLARLIALAGRESQIWITTHSQLLADTLARDAGARLIQLEMKDGATTVLCGECFDDDEPEPEDD
jgi:predicted ATPase